MAVADRRRRAHSGQPTPTFGIRGTVEETAWSSTPWPKHACKEDLRNTMGDRGRSMANDSKRVIKEMMMTGVWPMLTRTNYAEWALLMQVNLEGMEVWGAINLGGGSHKNDRITLGALLRGVPRCGHCWPRRRPPRRLGRH
jgi:hypothetical protein